MSNIVYEATKNYYDHKGGDCPPPSSTGPALLYGGTTEGVYLKAVSSHTVAAVLLDVAGDQLFAFDPRQLPG